MEYGTVKKLNGLFGAWTRIQSRGSKAVIWGRCIAHLSNPLFSGSVLHTSGVFEIAAHKSLMIAETRNSFYILLGPELVWPVGSHLSMEEFIATNEHRPPQAIGPFVSAAMTAEADCLKCHAAGVYRKSEHSFAVCDECCKHNLGWWLLEQSYGPDNGRWACKAGCGKVADAPSPQLEFLPRAVARPELASQ